MARLKRIITDFWGLCTVCGFSVGFRWLLAVITHFRASIRAGHLQLADGVLGDGPIAVRLGNARAKLICYRVLTGIRETWVRDGYLGHGFLKIAPDALVVDLGSNMGAVTTLALAHGPAVRVFAVEADPAELPLLQRNLDLNGWADRVTIINAFIGGRTQTQRELLATDRRAPFPPSPRKNCSTASAAESTSSNATSKAANSNSSPWAAPSWPHPIKSPSKSTPTPATPTN